MTLREDLEAVAELLEQGWCQGTYARDAHGNPVPLRDGAACSRCLSAAIELVAAPRVPVDLERYQAAGDMYQVIAETLGVQLGELVPWQDAPGRTQAEVAQLVRKAAEAAS